MNKNQTEIKPNLRDINAELGHTFTGTSQYHRWSYLFPWAYLTDGTKHVADTFDAYWFMDLIASYQTHPDVQKEHLQFWNLTVKDNRAIAKVDRDIDEPILHQKIEYTDFPDGTLNVWVAHTKLNGTFAIAMYLPSEH